MYKNLTIVYKLDELCFRRFKLDRPYTLSELFELASFIEAGKITIDEIPKLIHATQVEMHDANPAYTMVIDNVN